MKTLNYEESFGIVNWQEGFEKELEGRSLEEQLRCFASTEYASHKSIPYAELEARIRSKEYYLRDISPISPDYEFIVRDGMIVGLVQHKYDSDGEYTGKDHILPYQCFVYDYDSDNNGSGYKTRIWYRYLVCLPHNHTLW